MPRQATRSAARGPLDKLRGPVRKMAEEVFSVDADRAVLKDEPLLNGLSELQTKQALKVLDTYCANVQRQGSGRIQNKAAYLMSLIQSYKLGPSSGTPGSAQRLVERLSPPVRQAVEGVFDPVLDRVVLEDRALMELLAKVPEEQALAALKKYRATVQRRGRDAIDNRCGYLIGFLKQYQDGVAVVGVSSTSGLASRNALSVPSNSDGPSTANYSTNSSTSNGHNPTANGARNGAPNGVGGPPSATSLTLSAQPTVGSGGGGLGGGSNGSSVRPISYLQPSVRKQLEKLFESGKDKAVLEDVGLIKQLARLGEEQALAALKNYKEASKHRRDIHNKSAYLMGILRGYIEGTTPISKAPWEGRTSDDGPDAVASAVTVPPPTAGSNGSRARGRGRSSGPTSVDVEGDGANSTPSSQGPPQQQPSQSPQQSHLEASSVPSVQVCTTREVGGFASAPVQAQQSAPGHGTVPVTLGAISATPSTSPVTSPPLGSVGSGGLFLGGIVPNGVVVDAAQRYDPSSSLLYLEGGGGVSGFGQQVQPPAHQQPPRHASPHESLFGHHSSADHNGRQQQPLVGPGLLGGEFLSNGGGSDRGLVLGGGLAPPAAASHTGPLSSPSNPSLFGSGLLAGEDFGSSSNGSLGHTAPASPGSGSAQGSTLGLGSSSLSVAGSGAETPPGSDAGNDVPSSTLATTAVSTGSFSGAATSSCNGSTDCNSSSSPRSGEGTENTNTSNHNGVVGGMVDMLARLNLSKYVPVLAEAEVDMDALRLFGEDDLKDLGFPKGPRIKLLHEVQNVHFSPRA